MISMQMRDENLANFARINRSLQDLVLGSFTTIKHPDFIDFFQELENEAGYISGLGWLTSSCS